MLPVSSSSGLFQETSPPPLSCSLQSCLLFQGILQGQANTFWRSKHPHTVSHRPCRGREVHLSLSGFARQARRAGRRPVQRGESPNTVRLSSWMYRSRTCARRSMVRSRGLRPSVPPWLSQSSRSRRRDSSSRLCNLPDRSVATAVAGKLQRRSEREREGKGYPGKAKKGGGVREGDPLWCLKKKLMFTQKNMG